MWRYSKTYVFSDGEEAPKMRNKFVTVRDLELVNEQLSNLRRRVRKLKNATEVTPKPDEQHDLVVLVQNAFSEFEAVESLMLKLFDTDTILNSSVSGKRANSKVQHPKKPLDFLKMNAMKQALRKKYLDIGKKDITLKVHSVQQKLQRQRGNSSSN